MTAYNIQVPSLIYTSKLGIPEEYKSQVINKIYEIGDKQNQKSNVKASMSEWRVFETTSLFNPLFDRIRSSLKHTHYERQSKGVSETALLEEAWTAIYKKGDYTNPHSHFPSPIAFVYYVQADPTSAPLAFEGTNFKIYPEDDLLVFFDGSVRHSVETHQSSQDRLVIAGHFIMLNDS